MSGSDRKQHWETVHATREEQEVSWFQVQPTLSLSLLRQCRLSPEARIIDIGGGASRLVDQLLADGFRNLAVLDIAAAGLATAQQRLDVQSNMVEWIVADITHWQPAVQYDAWHDRAVFHFLVEAADREAYKTALAAGLKPGGWLVIGSFAEDGPEKCSGLPIRRYSASALSKEFGNGFRMLAETTEDHRTPGGVSQRFQYVLLQKIAGDES